MTPADVDLFARLGIPPELLERAGIVRVTDRQAREEFGIRGSGDMAGVAFPYFDPETMANGRRRNYVRIRRDYPEIEGGKEKKKYVAPYGDRKHFYFPPIPEFFADATVPIVLVEAEKSALALTAWAARIGRKILPIGMGGCFGWMGKIGTKETATGERVPENGPIPDLGICRDGRKTFVLLDANCSSNPKVQQARAALVRQLRRQNAAVAVLDLPSGEGINGPDDYVGILGDDAMRKLFDGWVDGAAIFEEMKGFLQRYVIMSEAQALVCTFWIIHTYLFPRYSGSTGYLHVSSPVPECGKSQLLEICELFVRAPATLGGATPAALIRVIDKERPTVLFDEADLNFQDKEMSALLCAIFNNGWRPGRPFAKCDGPRNEVKKFLVFGAKALAGIGTHYLAPATLTRCFPIKLQRHGAGRMAEEFFTDTGEEESRPIRKKLEGWASQRTGDWLTNKRPAGVPTWLNSRKKSIAFPLFAIAEDLGGTYSKRLGEALEEIFVSKSGKPRLDYKIQLLSDIVGVFEETDREVLETADLLKALHTIETSPWAEASSGKPLSATKLALLLSDFQVVPDQHWVGGLKIRGYSRADFLRAWEIYKPTPGQDPNPNPVGSVGTNVYAGPEHFSNPVGKASLPTLKIEESSMFMRGLPTLPTLKGGNGQGAVSEDPELPCPVHGKHRRWWVRILPDGGDMVCGKCEPEPAAESGSLFDDMGPGSEYPN